MDSSAIPIAAVVAVLIFLAREVVEAVRRHRADGRKRTSLRTVIARECELNNWTIKQLRNAVQEINGPVEGWDTDPNLHLSVHLSQRGNLILRRNKEDGGYTQGPLPHVHRDSMEKFIMDIAILDKKLLFLLLPAYDALADVLNLQDSMVDMIGSDDPNDRIHLTGFRDYALGELEDAETALKELYKECTGEDLTIHRLR